MAGRKLRRGLTCVGILPARACSARPGAAWQGRKCVGKLQSAHLRQLNTPRDCRYSKQAKDWGWREFLTLTTLFDADAGFLVNDAVQFTAEVLVLKESYNITEVPPHPTPAPPSKWMLSGYC